MTEETVKLAVQIAHILKQGEVKDADLGHWEIGANYFLRTVTHHLTGRLRAVTRHELWLEDAAWIADDGRFAQAIATGEFAEVEPYPTGTVVAVGRGALIDACKLTKDLPRSQK